LGVRAAGIDAKSSIPLLAAMSSGALQEIAAPPQKDPTIMNPAASDDHKAERFYGAARLCGSGSAVKFQDGSVWHEKQLYVRAIELNPSFAPAYHNLALALEDQESISIDGAEWDRQRLYIKAIERDPSFAPAYVNLSGLMGAEDTVTVGSGPALDRCALLLQAIQVDPRCAMAYMNLGILLPPQGRVQMPNGAMLSPAALMATAQQLDPSLAPPLVTSTVATTPQRAIQISAPTTPGSLIMTPPGSLVMTPQKLTWPTSPAGPRQVVVHPAPLPSLLGSSGGVTAALKAPTQSATLGSGSLAAQP